MFPIGLLLIIAVSTLLIIWLKTNGSENIDKSKIDKIQVKMQGLFPNDYVNTSCLEFIVSDTNNIDYIVETIEKSANISNNQLDNVATKYTFIIHNTDGGSTEHTIRKFDLLERTNLSKVLNSEVVLKQIRKVFFVNLEEVSSFFLYHWEEFNTDRAESEKIAYDKETLKTIVNIAQKEVLNNPDKVLENTQCGVLFENKEGNTIFALGISRDMYTYNEIISLLPQIEQYIK